MSATISTSGNIARINLAGEFDYSTQENLNGVFDKALNSPANEICIDMQKTLFIDSSIIRMLLKLHDTTRRSKKSLTLVNCSARIMEILTIGGFDQILDIR
jgi:anti-anti-sigma factor